MQREAFTMTDALVSAYPSPYDEYLEESGLEEQEGAPGVWVAAGARSDNPLAILQTLGATRADAGVIVLVDVFRVTVCDGAEARIFGGEVEVLHAGERVVHVGPPRFEANPEAGEDDQAPGTLVEREVFVRAVFTRADAGPWQRRAQWGLFEQKRFAEMDHPTAAPAAVTVTRARLAVVVLSDPNVSVQLF